MIGPGAVTSRIARLALVASGVVVVTPRALGQSVWYNLSAQNVTQGTVRGNVVFANLGDVIRI